MFSDFSKKSLLKLVFKVPSVFYKLIFSIIFTAIICSYKFESIEVFFFDLRTIVEAKIGLSSNADSPIVIITVNSKTIDDYNGLPGYREHFNLLSKISKIKSKNIVYNYRNENGLFSEIDGSYEDKLKFSELASSSSEISFITYDLALRGEEDSLKLRVPLDKINLLSGPKTNDTQLGSKLPISRRILLTYDNQELIHLKLAKIYNPNIKNLNSIESAFEHLGTIQTYIRYSPLGSFKSYSFHEVLRNDFDISKLENKLIIIGSDTQKYPADYVSTPYSTETADQITITELQANMFQTLIKNNSPYRAGNTTDWIITFLTALITIYASLSVKPSKGISLLIGLFIFIFSTSCFLLSIFNIWINLAHPLLTIFLCYYFFIPYRLIIENRRSWEYFQKNKLLHQVEELKTNFISMMSHDLKTPIARIQGMTEVILKDPVTLSPTQREAVDTIKGSSDDLLKFINSILQYGRIESQGVELHKQSKDINQLITDVIKKHEFLAKVKKIKINTELEPLFPIQIDVELMKQVVSNLVENAIKYSHEESTVQIKSYEDGQNVVIEVTDNGVGIPAEDLPNIFMKFYRSHNVKTSTIKGTGLGLYLAQYFAELHKGKITVTSEAGKGSTFKLTLPS